MVWRRGNGAPYDRRVTEDRRIMVKRLNLWLTLASLNVLLITAERFSPTTQVLLQPANFLRLHELVQMAILILLSVLIPCFTLHTLTAGLATLQQPRGRALAVAFIVGVYFYATGNGAHEISSFLWNQYCPQNNNASAVCASMFFDDYYFGNIVYFVGAFLLTVPLVVLERMRPSANWTRGDYVVLVSNSVLYAFAIMAYAAFDRVLVGLVYVLITTAVVDLLLLRSRATAARLPYTLYTALSYSLGALAAVIIRLQMR